MKANRIGNQVNYHSPVKGMPNSTFANADYNTQMMNQAIAAGMPYRHSPTLASKQESINGDFFQPANETNIPSINYSYDQ